MRPKLELRQTQKLIMTTNLQQAIELLLTSRLELTQIVQQELLQNPLLEEVVTPEDEFSESREQEGKEEEEKGEEVDREEGDGSTEFDIDWENYIQDNIDLDFSGGYLNEYPSTEATLAGETTLFDHLSWQLNLSCREEEERQVGAALIGNIDDDGYVRCDLDEIAQECGVSVEVVEKVLTHLIQTFEPTGVGARDLRECLLLQAQGLEQDKELVEEIIRNHLHRLEERDFLQIAKVLEVSLERVLQAYKVIKSFNPSPGSRFNIERTEYITPDVLVVKNGEDYQVIINDEGIPRLRVNPYYRNILKGGDDTRGSVRQFVEEKFRSAIWLIKGIEQRRQTLYKVSCSIVTFQHDFFDHGLEDLKPLVLRDVAQDIGMHESTISRVTSNKYMNTPQGLFELKYFFHSSLVSKDGDAFSSKNVKNMIKQLISHEDPLNPLTDDEIVKRLQENSIVIARRTVNKYRKEQKIPSSSKRKKPYWGN